MSLAALQALLTRIETERDCDAALDLIAKASITIAGGRNAMIARMNDAEGRLELRHGAGLEWSEAASDISLGVGTKEGIVSYVAATGATVVSGNVQGEPRYKNLFSTTKSEVAVPIRGEGGRLRAVLNVESDRLDAFGEDHRISCEALASIAALVIDREDGVSREEALVQVGLALDTALTEEDLISQVMRVAGDVLRFQACSIFLHERETDSFVLRGSVGRLKERVGELRYKRGEGCTGWVCETGKPMNLDSPMSDPRWRGKFVEFPSEEIAHFLAVPVMSRGRCIGAIRVIRRVTENPYLDNRFTDSDVRVLQSIAEQVGTGLENIRNVETMIRSERMIAWGELSAKSSHMIGNRMFALKGDVNELGHLLESSSPSLEDLKAIQASLSKNVMRVEQILQDFRDFLTATQIKRETGDLNAVVRETVAEVFPRRGGVKLVLELGENLPAVSIDSAKLGRAISELVENAMHHVDEGRLTVATSMAEDAECRKGRVAPGKRYVKLEIEDSGPGIGDDRKNQIFEPFFSGRVKGMGLGLSIVKGIVDAHGGGVYEGGAEGQGAKFVILLPVSERP